MHQHTRFNKSSASIQLFLDCKEQVKDTAATAAVHDKLPLSFAYHETGFMSIVKTLTETGQSY